MSDHESEKSPKTSTNTTTITTTNETSPDGGQTKTSVKRIVTRQIVSTGGSSSSQYGTMGETRTFLTSSGPPAANPLKTLQLEQISDPPRPAVRQRTLLSLRQAGSSSAGAAPVATSSSISQQAKAFAGPGNSSSSSNSRSISLSASSTKSNLQQQQTFADTGKQSSELEEPSAVAKTEQAAQITNQPEPISEPIRRLSAPQALELHASKLDLLPNQPLLQRRPYPKKVLFIVANEFCERFSYYGLRTVLVLYLKNVLGFSDSSSTVAFHLFTTLCYLTPILGAILADSILGKFSTILYLSIVYFLGEILLLVSSVLWYQGPAAVAYFFLGLFMIGLGTGGIKPCVSALGGDQFLTNEDKWRQGFFSLFYGAINLGSLISMFTVPILRSNFRCVEREDCYPLAFGLPCLLMFVAIVVFVLAKSQYRIVPLPERNVILTFCQCVWLALKRKFAGGTSEAQISANLEARKPIKYSGNSDNTSNSTISVSSEEEMQAYPSKIDGPSTSGIKEDVFAKQLFPAGPSPNKSAPAGLNVTRDNATSGSHWLHLSLDRYDLRSIEEFRSVLAILLLFVPLPVYWCLFDQQGSLWTLQASRMDGNLFGFTLQPDQMSVANPLLLLTAIPIFEIFIYPALGRYNILTKPIQRMTFGGMLAALAFVASAGIESRIQRYLPPTQPALGRANLIFVNGLADCSILEPTILRLQVGAANVTLVESGTDHNLTRAVLAAANQIQPFSEGELRPLHAQLVDLDALDSHQVKFRLASQQKTEVQQQVGGPLPASQKLLAGCPFSASAVQELSVAPVTDRAVKFLYVEHGNGKIAYKLFNESLALPPVGKARVRLIYESFGSYSDALKRNFHLVRLTNAKTSNSSLSNKLQFKSLLWEGQVGASEHLDLDVPANGELFELRSNDPKLNLYSSPKHQIFIEPGTRNLIVAHQRNGTFAQVKFQLLQDNKYQISMLYQLAPYLLISVSEVMFSITGLEFSYSMAPENMKSLILSAWNLTTAFGNILTVAVESLQLFSNVALDFLFYATLMALDMILFAVIGHYYTPYKAT